MASWLLAVVFAPFIGSFIGVVTARWERPRTIVTGRSACLQCGHPLAPRDLVPLASWLAARGRCRYCDGPIALRYPAIELAALGVAAWAALVVPDWAMWHSVAFGWVLLALAVVDLEHYVLPDFLTLPLLLGGLAQGWTMQPDEISARLLGSAAGFLFVVALRFAYQRLRGREGIGLGDAKLLGALGAWVGWAGLPTVLLVASLLGLGVALVRGQLRKGSLADRVPFGAYLCVGAWIVWLHGPFTFMD